MAGDKEEKKGQIIFDKEFGKGEYADVIGVGVVMNDEEIDCVHLSFGQLLPDKREGGRINEHVEPISHVIMTEIGAKQMRDGLIDALGEKERGE